MDKIEYLKNGIPVLISENKNVETITFGIFVKTGSINEKPYENGVSHYIEHMMFKGTKTRSAQDISGSIDSVGGMINAYTSSEKTAYYTQILANKFDIGIEIMTDMFLNSTFTQENLDKEKKVIIEEIKMYGDRPDDLIHEENLLFAIDGVESNRVAGTIESVQNIDREIFMNYYNEHYIAENMIISVVGNVPANLIDKLNAGFGTIKKGNCPTPNLDYTINSGNFVINRDTQQVHLCFNSRGVSDTNPLKYSASIISNILAGNMSSRLFLKIREERGLAYTVFSYMSSFEKMGLFTIYAGTTYENYKEVIEIIRSELLSIKKDGITSEELTKAKNKFLTGLVFGLENSKAKMAQMATLFMLYGEIIPQKELVNQIESITLDDIKKVANTMFDEKYFSTTILGNFENQERKN